MRHNRGPLSVDVVVSQVADDGTGVCHCHRQASYNPERKGVSIILLW